MPKYPLQPLLEHRERRVDDAAVELAHAEGSRDAAERAHVRAEAMRHAAEASADRVRTSEGERLAEGELRAIDLERAAGWEVAAQARIGELTRAEDAAAETLRDAEKAAAGARAELARRIVDRDVVAKDETRFQAREAERAIAKEEEAADEIFAARQASQGGGMRG